MRNLPAPIGVYALCDLDDVPVYVGRSKDGIRRRVQRHLTSARSDVIANRMIDVWEIAYVHCWPVTKSEHLAPLEAHLFNEFNKKSQLMNGSVMADVKLAFPVPEMTKVQILPTQEIADRLRVQLRVSRQAKHFSDFLDHFLGVKDSSELLLALTAHFGRLRRYFSTLRGIDDGEGGEED